MDSTHCNERPVSYGSTSSSASSRDSHCSLGGRPVLGSAPERDHDSGAIRLELVPAQQLEEEETGRQTPTLTNQSHADIQSPEGRKVQYVDRVVEEILETEKTYVQDLRSIVQDYLECISNQSLLLLGDEERSSLFGNIHEIYRFNSDLLHDLEKCNANPVAIAKYFKLSFIYETQTEKLLRHGHTRKQSTLLRLLCLSKCYSCFIALINCWNAAGLCGFLSCGVV
uniref:DH domain-containing protein n=1 Tax=Sinocyclocheilus anshuiensis TaxID=1608454 RepID=A0A671KQ05_9TELE